MDGGAADNSVWRPNMWLRICFCKKEIVSDGGMQGMSGTGTRIRTSIEEIRVGRK